jgi:hypothetical protein
MRTGRLIPIALILSTLVIANVCSVSAAEIFADPDTVYITTGPGTEFELEIEVDAATTGFRLFQIVMAFDTTLLDTTYTELGPLFSETGEVFVFNSFIVEDTIFGSTVLRLEGLLFGASAVVDGPGVVARVGLEALAEGVADMSVVEHVITDISNDTIPSSARGSFVYINTPPDPFDLLEPVDGADIGGNPGDSIEFGWTASGSPYPGELVSYFLEINETADFSAPNSLEFSGLTFTNQKISNLDLTNGQQYFWRVTATGNLYGFEQASTPASHSFTLNAAGSPNDFDLLLPEQSTYVDISSGGALFDWQDSPPLAPGDSVLYKLALYDDPSMQPANMVWESGDINVSELVVDESNLPVRTWLYWEVTAENTYGFTKESLSNFDVMFYWFRDFNGDKTVNIQDLTLFVGYLFGGGAAPIPEVAVDLNSDGSLNIADLTALVNYLFGG